MSASTTADALIGALDQGTSSTRFLVFCSQTGELVTYHQQEISLHYPHPGWVEQDPMEILRSALDCMEKAVDNLRKLDIAVSRLKAVGITNQRETTVVWDKETGLPLEKAIVWLDTRTSAIVDELSRLPEYGCSRVKELCGLPLSTYFSAVKLRWLLEHSDKVRLAVAQERCLFGTVDSWLLWNLTGGPRGGVHLTDVTNASRTMLMNLRTLDWDDRLCRFFEIPRAILPAIRSSSEVYGSVSSGCLQGVPISGMLGDQQAALVGQGCLQKGQAKNTYGTGCFLLYNVGAEPVLSSHGLLSTVAFKFGDEAPCYALEGSVAIAGAAVRWLRDNLGVLSSASDIEAVASSVSDSGGVYFVPAFSGLYAPHWDSSARGTICGMTQATTSAHIARAVLESVCFQTREMIEAMHSDSGTGLASLQVDGGMTVNSLLMQLQSDLLGIDIVRPSMPETTALGAALAAARAVGLSCLFECAQSTVDTFHPSIARRERDARFLQWRRAVDRSKGWLLPLVEPEQSGASLLSGGVFLLASFALLVLSTESC